jgi:hypothetical protein
VRTSARHAGWLTAAPVLGLLLYWRVPSMWFQDDDFAWLSLGRDLHEHGLWHALFTPFAQGTVRILDRIHFLALSESFGSWLPPYRVLGLATWIIALTLVLLIGERLTGSRAAGVLAAMLWAANANSAPAIVWISAYYQLLCAVCLLGALYSRLKGWRVAEWVCYLAAFGAMEIAPMYAVIAVACALACTPAIDRKQLGSTMWLLVPAAIYTLVHFLFIPKSAFGPYVLALDSRLPSTIASYLGWTFEPGSSALRSHAEQWGAAELLLGMILGLALGWFAVRRLWQREWVAGVFCAWFVALLAPLLLLPSHVTSYYLTLPSIGLAWLAGWAIARGWATGGFTRVAVLGMAAAYFLGNAAGIQAQTRWFQSRSRHMRTVVDGVGAAAMAHPGDAIALQGVDEELYQSGFDSHPFLLVGAERVWRVPADISAEDLRDAVAKGHTRVLEVNADGGTRDITGLGN